MRSVPRLLLATPLLILVAGCTSGLKKPITTAEIEPDSKGVQRVEVNMHSYYFEPSRIVVHAGHPVELVLKNRAKLVPHNVTFVDTSFAKSEGAWLGTGHLHFTPQRPGEYEFYCHVDAHAKKGMTGVLVVVP
jgi:plastocyanin